MPSPDKAFVGETLVKVGACKATFDLFIFLIASALASYTKRKSFTGFWLLW